MTNRGNDDLEILISAIKAKDKKAFHTLYDVTINQVYSLALKITRSNDLADEVISDVYFQIWQHTDKYDEKRNGVVAWLMVLCRSRALDLLRKKTRISDKENNFTLQNKNLENSQTNLLESIDNQSAIFSALSILNSQQQQLISLAYFKGYTHSELVTVSGLPLGTVKTNLRRSLDKMQQHLESFEE